MALSVTEPFVALGEWFQFALQTLSGVVHSRLRSRVFIPVFFTIGVQSVFVVFITGLFIGMVMAVQSFTTFHQLGMDTWLGSIVNVTLVKELGPVLAATMLAGRVGSSMAAELGTMRVTEQIDALTCLGVNPVHYLVVPRFLACVLLIPLLTVIADAAGIVGSALVSIEVFQIESHHYWLHSRAVLGVWEIASGLVKSICFGGVIALVSCHRGFRSRGGSEGVGRAATEAFVLSFMSILVLDFFLGLLLNGVTDFLWPRGAVLK